MVTFEPMRVQTEARENETILDVARRAGVAIGNSCGAIGVCGRCRIRIVNGAEPLLPPTSIEVRLSQQRGFEEGERLACQAVVIGDCAVTTSYW
ncbi:MAG TPA: 2Fe-2S iron-sulfur cluster-binding protein [Thermoanaerobaculia bacterium]|nr:2Fe-2S iron-sulfur cluster-binding protein [Thermoanaerobaculia bacterium]